MAYEHLDADEQKAVKQGWVPKDEWKGNPDRWTDAKSFNDRTSEYLPSVKKQLEQERVARVKLEERLKQQDDTYNRRIKANETMSREALRLQQQRLMEDFDEQKRQAAAKGDIAAYNAADQKEKRFYADVAKQVEKVEPVQERVREEAPPQSERAQLLKDWAAKNTWIANPLLASTAHAVGERLSRKNAGMPPEEQLRIITEEVAKRHPDLMEDYGFEAPKEEREERRERASHTSVESGVGGRQSTPRSNKRGWKDIPKDDRDAAEREYIQKKLYGRDLTDDKAREKYASRYWAEYGDE